MCVFFFQKNSTILISFAFFSIYEVYCITNCATHTLFCRNECLILIINHYRLQVEWPEKEVWQTIKAQEAKWSRLIRFYLCKWASWSLKSIKRLQYFHLNIKMFKRFFEFLCLIKVTENFKSKYVQNITSIAIARKYQTLDLEKLIPSGNRNARYMFV